jgi:hypothetical protein
MQVLVELPNTPRLLNHHITYYQQLLFFSLYHLQQLSEKEVCDNLNLTRREFAELLSKFGLSAINEQDNNLAQAQQLLGTEYSYLKTTKTDQELLEEALTERYL